MGHILKRRPDGAVECVLCRLYVRDSGAKSMGRFRRQHCGGSIYDRIDGSHALRTSSGVTWCFRCGGFTSRWLRSLLEPCRGRPPTAARRTILRRLNAGLPPTAQAYLSQVVVDGGAPGSAPDHRGITEWTTGTSSSRSSIPNEGRDIPGPRIAAAPSGIYKRLPAFHGRADVVAEAPPPPPPAGRTPPTASSRDEVRVCPFDGRGSATGRLRAVAMRAREPCGVCAAPTATTCRLCDDRLCLGCARSMKRCGKRQFHLSTPTPEPLVEVVAVDATCSAGEALDAAVSDPLLTSGRPAATTDGSGDDSQLARYGMVSTPAPRPSGPAFGSRGALLRSLCPTASISEAGALLLGVPRRDGVAEGGEARVPRDDQGLHRPGGDHWPREPCGPRDPPSPGGMRPPITGSGEVAAGGPTHQASAAVPPEECRWDRFSNGRRDALLRALRRGASQAVGAAPSVPAAAPTVALAAGARGRSATAIYDHTYGIRRPARHRSPRRSAPAETRSAGRGVHDRCDLSFSLLNGPSRRATINEVAVHGPASEIFNDASATASAAGQASSAHSRGRNGGHLSPPRGRAAAPLDGHPMIATDVHVYSDRPAGLHHPPPLWSVPNGHGARTGAADHDLDHSLAAGAVSSSLTSSVSLPLRWQGLSAAAGAGDAYVEVVTACASSQMSTGREERLGSANLSLILCGSSDQTDCSPD